MIECVFSICCSGSQAMFLDGYAEVVDGIRQHSFGQDNERGESVAQAPASIADRSTPPEEVSQSENRSLTVSQIKEAKKTKPSVLPFLSQLRLVRSKAAAVRTRSEVISHSTNDSTEHLYDSVDGPVRSKEHVYHVLESPKGASAQQQNPDGPHVYHVLEGPTNVLTPTDTGGERCLTNVTIPQPPLPPKPPRCLAIRHRMMSCAAVASPSTDTPEDKKVHFLHSMSASSSQRSVSDQLKSVMAIYEEVPIVEKGTKSSTSILPPPVPVKPGVHSGAVEKDKDHVYHLLEAVETTSRVPSDSQQQQQTEQTLKDYSETVSQTCHQQNADESNVCKTKEVCFQLELPKQTTQEITEERKYAKPFSLKKTLSSDHKCQLFDDPAYCTQQHRATDPGKVGGGSDKPQFDDPSYATPSVNVKQKQDACRQIPNNLFDDPKYNCPTTQERGTRPEEVKFDDPKYQITTHTRNPLHKRVLNHDKQTVRHSSSMEHVSASIYSSTSDFLDTSEKKTRGNSLEDLKEIRRNSTVKKCARIEGIRFLE